MKDYYKILGLDETATGEEIHERWIELMQEYHPDHNLEGKSNEQMAMEINEAYQVLKHSASRMAYDLQRQHQKGQRKSSAWKVTVPVAGLTILLIIVALFLREPEAPVSMNQPLPLPGGKIIVPREEAAEQAVAFAKPSPSEGMAENERAEEKKLSSGAPKRPAGIPPQPIRKEAKPAPLVPKTNAELAPSAVSVRAATSPARRSSPEESVAKKRPLDQRQEKASETPEEISAVGPLSDSTRFAKTESRPESSILPPPLATEGEVLRFFDQYVERYNRRDLQGFLSLFSSKAVQNQKEGWEGIQRIYENFFEQSRDLRYSMENTSVEVYQNAVEVKAGYTVNQISKKDGERRIWRGRIQWMLVREDGELKIISLNYRHDAAP